MVGKIWGDYYVFFWKHEKRLESPEMARILISDLNCPLNCWSEGDYCKQKLSPTSAGMSKAAILIEAREKFETDDQQIHPIA